ncbi:protein of unknown function [Sinosporangium album]|uniref:DUF4190 domain-containing protein n=1 Tax=Sinosporangium album TaxID=504805 RepID=A0A1G7RC96_9ACTN|nr:DUF4190 domain-containing protein [Sinosporangium album]SDG08284.1 protein of unknown function [Sinosporangium album]
MYDQNPPNHDYPTHASGYPGQGPGYGGYGAPPPRTNGLAIASLVFGILWLCGLGSLLAVILGHVALIKIRTTHALGRGLAIAGLVLGYLGIVSTVVSVAVFGLFTNAAIESYEEIQASAEANANPVEETSGPEETAQADTTPADKEASSAVPTPTRSTFTASDYRTLSGRGFAKLTKDPDAYTGKQFIIYGEVTQFDAATGTTTFRADTGHAKLQPSYGFVDFDQNALLTGSESRLSDVVQGDLFQAYVTSLGSESYETQIGGNTTVPSFQVDRIKVYGSLKK